MQIVNELLFYLNVVGYKGIKKKPAALVVAVLSERSGI